MLFRVLWPQPAEVEIGAHMAALRLGDLAGETRAYAVANFIASLDGRATFKGRSGGLGDEGDKAMFRALRETADAVLVGTRTLQVERYGRLLVDPAARERRADSGREPEPLGCVVTRSGALPLDIPLFAEAEARVVVFSAVPLRLNGVRAQVEVVHIPLEELTFAAALTHLRLEYGVRLVLCEGGPTITAALLREGVLDELFLTLAPRLTGGGSGPGVLAGPELSEPAGARLAGALEREGSLFLRYQIAAAGS